MNAPDHTSDMSVPTTNDITIPRRLREQDDRKAQRLSAGASLRVN